MSEIPCQRITICKRVILGWAMKYIETFELTVAIKNIYTYTFCVLACCFGMVKVSAKYRHLHS